MQSNFCSDTNSIAPIVTRLLHKYSGQRVHFDLHDDETQRTRFELVLFTLSVICNTHSECASLVRNWALDLFLCTESASAIEAYPLVLYNLILFPARIQSNVDDDNFQAKITTFIDKLLCSNVNAWNVYRIVRIAFRYAHWNSVALPLLQSIKNKVKNIRIHLLCIHIFSAKTFETRRG